MGSRRGTDDSISAGETGPPAPISANLTLRWWTRQGDKLYLAVRKKPSEAIQAIVPFEAASIFVISPLRPAQNGFAPGPEPLGMILEGFHLGLLENLTRVGYTALLVDEAPEVLGGPVVFLDPGRGFRQKHRRVVMVLTRRANSRQVNRDRIRVGYPGVNEK